MLLGFGVALAAAAAAPATIEFTRPDGTKMTATALTDNIIRVAPAGRALESRIAVTPKGDFTGTASANSIVTSTGVKVSVDPSTGALSISGGGRRGITDSGRRGKDASGRHTLALGLPGRPAHVYGGGERGYSFNLQGDTLEVYNTQNYGYVEGDRRISRMNITMPLLVYPEGYAVLFDDIAAAEMIPGDSLRYATEAPAEPAYYYINSPEGLAGMPRELTALTGRQELPPFWSLAYITSKYGYRTEAEALGVIDSLKTAGYPVDGMVLDLYWYGKEEDMGRLAWDQQQWPDHKKMLSDLKEHGVNTVIISQPYILRNGRGLENYNELASKGLLVKDSTGGPQEVKIWVGEGGMFDVSNPDTRSWLSERYKALTLEGVGGWWGDLGEPEVHPETGIHANGLSAREYHNLYGNDWSSVISDLFASEFPDRRLMTMMRGGTTGLQRYSVYPWSTDVSRSWGGLQPQITIMLNSGLSGLGYMSHDVGGFAIDPDAPYDPELYVRWLQLGTFSPILRTHAQATAEPYNYPDQQHIILPLIKERYRWLPYNYTLAYENASQGLPLVRPLNFYSSGSDRFDDITDEYLWGCDILVAPVMTQGATRRSIVFPDGLWVDYNNPGRLYNGGDTVTYPAPLEVLPLFVRAGAIIPQADYGMQSTEDYRTDRYTINYYPYLGKSEYTLFEDDRKSPGSLDEGAYSLINFTGEASIEGINLDISSQGTYPGAPKVKDLTFRIHLVDGDPSSVSVDGHKLKRGAWKFDRSESMLTFKIKWNVDKPLAIHIR